MKMDWMLIFRLVMPFMPELLELLLPLSFISTRNMPKSEHSSCWCCHSCQSFRMYATFFRAYQRVICQSLNTPRTSPTATSQLSERNWSQYVFVVDFLNGRNQLILNHWKILNYFYCYGCHEFRSKWLLPNATLPILWLKGHGHWKTLIKIEFI